jgi:hypothetical protein
MLWGAWVANPFWSVFSRAPLYDAMASIAPEWAWGLFAIFIGCVILYGVLKPSYKTLTRAAWAACWHWAVIAGFYFVADYMNTGGITSLTFAIYAAFIYLNIKVNKVLPTKQEHHRQEKES